MRLRQEAMKGNVRFPPLLNHFKEGGEVVATMVSSPSPYNFLGPEVCFSFNTVGQSFYRRGNLAGFIEHMRFP